MMLYRIGIEKMYSSVKIIHMTRSNLVDQAVSYLIACHTQKWTSKSDVEPAYDYALINRLIRESMMDELNVRTIASVFQAHYLKVDFWGLTRQPINVMQSIGRL